MTDGDGGGGGGGGGGGTTGGSYHGRGKTKLGLKFEPSEGRPSAKKWHESCVVRGHECNAYFGSSSWNDGDVLVIVVVVEIKSL